MNTNPKQRKDYNLGDHNRPQTTLGDLNRPQTIIPTKQHPIDRIEMIAQVRENKVFGNKTTKKTLGKTTK